MTLTSFSVSNTPFICGCFKRSEKWRIYFPRSQSSLAAKSSPIVVCGCWLLPPALWPHLHGSHASAILSLPQVAKLTGCFIPFRLWENPSSLASWVRWEVLAPTELPHHFITKPLLCSCHSFVLPTRAYSGDSAFILWTCNWQTLEPSMCLYVKELWRRGVQRSLEEGTKRLLSGRQSSSCRLKQSS